MLSTKTIYRKDVNAKPFLLSLLFLGLSYGLYKGVLDNYMAEVGHIGEFDRGVVEFFRELPGLLLIVTLAILSEFSEKTIFTIGCSITAIGLASICFLPPGKALLIIGMTIYSFGEHINLGMKSAISLDMASPLRGGEALGLMNAIGNAGNIFGFVVVSILFAIAPTYKGVFFAALILQLCAVVCSLFAPGQRMAQKRQNRFYFRRKFKKYYMLEVFYGARKQVFLTFGPYVLILFYKAPTSVIGMLYAICAVCGMALSPAIGKLIDKLGYRTVMIADTLILVIVCFFYGFSHRFFSPHTAFILACCSYVLDSIISLASMASSVYVRDIADDKEEVTATLSTGISVNHLISIMIALTGGWIWQNTGIEVLFTMSALLGIANSIYAASIPKKKKA